jgi:aspartate dehydrogenase
MVVKVAVAGVGAIGSAVCRALIDGIEGFELVAASSLDPDYSKKLIARPEFNLLFMNLNELAEQADWVVEALPVAAIPPLARQVTDAGKTLVMISSAALLLHPELKNCAGNGRILVPTGALAGIDGINALAEQGIKTARLTTTKPPKSLANAPYIEREKIDLNALDSKTLIFSGNALQAAAAFPANVNVAATLTLASRLPPEAVQVEVWADPALTSNRHEVLVEGNFSTLNFRIENKPDPSNPKSSALTALSIISALRRQTASFVVGC